MRRTTLTLITLIAVPTLGLAACGNDDDVGDTADGGASTSIEATATEFQFDPDAWIVPAGEELTIDFTNDGSLEHEWAVLELGEDIESEDEFTEDKVLLEVEAIEPDSSTTQTFTIDDAGTYQVICAIPTHFDAGMEGELTVE